MPHLLHFLGELCRRGSLARAVQAHEQDDGWGSRCHRQRTVAISHQSRQLITDDFDYLLTWG
jgi:hypothetical protein